MFLVPRNAGPSLVLGKAGSRVAPPGPMCGEIPQPEPTEPPVPDLQ
jgi:hypothetical protein